MSNTNSNRFDWLSALLRIAPYIIAGIGTVHQDAVSGVEKKQIATDALNIATQGAEAVDPNDAQITEAASNVAGLVIDATINDRKPEVISQVIEHHVTQLKTQGLLPGSGAPQAAAGQ